MNILIGHPSEPQSLLNSQRSTPRAHRIGGRSNNCSSLKCEIFVGLNSDRATVTGGCERSVAVIHNT